MEKSQWQLASELSRFDDGGRREAIERQRALATEAVSSRAPAVPGAVDALYDPTHPDADYAGLVPRERLGRGHFAAPAAARVQLAPAPDGSGFVPDDAAPTRDYGAEASGKRRYADDARFVSFDCAPPGASVGRGATGAGMIGGVGGYDPSEHYQSVAAAQGVGERTRAEQLADHRQAAGKMRVVPQYEQQIAAYVATQQRHGGLAPGPPGAAARGAPGAYAPHHSAPRAGDPGGYRSQSGRVSGGGSMLASIGKAVARSDLGDAPCLAHGPSGMGPAKEMLKENFQPATAIPGYTGRRRV